MIETKAWVNGQPHDQVSVVDRALLYGHSVFETIRVRHGQALLLDLHLARLEQACESLFIPVDQTVIASELVRFCADVELGIVRLTVSIGAGGRGYLTPSNAQPTRILTLHPLPDYAPEIHSQGVLVGVSDIRLATQPHLAGIKHGNRLEQLLIRRSWHSDWQEALVFDYNNKLIEGTQSNVFVRRGSTVVTPDLRQAGVAGVMREYILNAAPQLEFTVEVGELSATDLAQADEVVLSNSVIGTWPVARIHGNSLVADKTFNPNEFKLNLSLTQLSEQHGVL